MVLKGIFSETIYVMCVHLCTRFQVSRIILSFFRQGGGNSPRLGLSLKDYWNYVEEKSSHKMNTTLTVAKHSKRNCLLCFLTCHFFFFFFFFPIFICCALFSCNTRFEICPFTLLPSISGSLIHFMPLVLFYTPMNT